MIKSAIFASGLLLISMSSSASINDLTSACNLLSNNGIKIRKIHQDQYDNLYHCNSDYYEVNEGTFGSGLKNNIAYYVTGPDSSHWNEIKIIANINSPTKITETHKKLREILGKLSSDLAGKKITFDDNPDTVTDDFFSMVHAGKYNKATDWFQSGHLATLTVNEWSNHKGFEYRFILKK